MTSREDLEFTLNAFDPSVRRDALAHLVADHAGCMQPAGLNVNMHLHSFFSYNAAGWSPSRLVWEARKAGLYAAGLCDFDVLEGLEECFEAGRSCGLRTTVNLETRAFVPEFSTVDINSPGEPGVAYIMGGGFWRLPPPASAAGRELAAYAARAAERNTALIGRVNARLPEISVDYARDVLPLTPAGNATERHIIRAYIQRAESVFPELSTRTGFWSRVLDKDAAAVGALLADVPACEEAVRSRLAKRGGFGYEQPSAESFPDVDTFVQWVLDCGAIPLTTWLDGTTPGESDPDVLIDTLTAKGCAGVNIIPDRNWNVADLDRQRRLTACLDAFVAAAVRRGQPVNIGTEMNKDGLPFVDNLEGPVLKRYQQTFVSGAALMVGHTILARYADCAYTGERARVEFPDQAARNRFFEAVGRLPPLTCEQADSYLAQGAGKTFATLSDAVCNG